VVTKVGKFVCTKDMAQQRSLFSFFNKRTTVTSDDIAASSTKVRYGEGKKGSSEPNHNQHQSPASTVKRISSMAESEETSSLQNQWPPPGFGNSNQQSLVIRIFACKPERVRM
jgi:hypothetical protein